MRAPEGDWPEEDPGHRTVRTFRSDLGLKEANALVDSAPTKILEGALKEQAESAANALQEQDAVVEVV